MTHHYEPDCLSKRLDCCPYLGENHINFRQKFPRSSKELGTVYDRINIFVSCFGLSVCFLFSFVLVLLLKLRYFSLFKLVLRWRLAVDRPLKLHLTCTSKSLRRCWNKTSLTYWSPKALLIYTPAMAFWQADSAIWTTPCDLLRRYLNEKSVQIRTSIMIYELT